MHPKSPMYDIYHVERLQNAFDDIDKMIEEKLVKRSLQDLSLTA